MLLGDLHFFSVKTSGVWEPTRSDTVGPLEDHREQIPALCRRFGVKRLDAFGSAVTEDGFDPQRSDIDLLVEFETTDPKSHARAYFGLLAALQDMLDCPVDLLEIKAVSNPYLLETIHASRRRIYAA